MSRSVSLAAGPEAILAALTAAVFLFAARHMSYSAADVRMMERLVWLLPLVAVPLAFITFQWTGGKSWGWLVRANVAVLICLILCAYRIVDGFGAPGSGPKGQDAGFILMVALGAGFSAIANAVCGSLILRAHYPAVAEWFRSHTIAGPIVTAFAALPILVLQSAATGAVVGFLAMVLVAFKR